MRASLCISLPIEGGEKCYGMLKNADSGSNKFSRFLASAQ